MLAAVHTKYGSPEVVRVVEIDTPVPAANEILIRVQASTVNRTDCGFRSAEYFISRFWSGLFRPRQQTLGCEFAGEVVAVGAEVSKFKVGDRVFGYNDKTFGGHAQYLCQPENAPIGIIPAHLDYFTTAALTEGAHYALNDIYAAGVKPGDDVMIYGASGAIGSAAVQLLNYMGVHVSAVCGTKHVSLIKQLGAEEVIDYQTQDFTQTDKRFDFVFDAVGKISFGKCKSILKSPGIYISTELGAGGQNVWYAMFKSLMGSKKVLFPIPVINAEMIAFIQRVAEEQKFTPVVDKIYDLKDIREAYNYVETGQKTGNVIINCA